MHRDFEGTINILIICWLRDRRLQSLVNILEMDERIKLYVFHDGYENLGEGSEKTVRAKATRGKAQELYDLGKVHKIRFEQMNNGCKRGPEKAISWFFENVEEGIILEDDVYPSSDFIEYCAQLLERYRFDDRVGAISGNAFSAQDTNTKLSYRFSRYFHSWGWATWRRSWCRYRGTVDGWFEPENRSLVSSLGGSRFRYFWTMIFKRIYSGSLSSAWDYIWQYTLWTNGQLVCVPMAELITYYGEDDDATHTSIIHTRLKEVSGLEFPLIHPIWYVADKSLDSCVFTNNHWPRFYTRYTRKACRVVFCIKSYVMRISKKLVKFIQSNVLMINRSGYS